MNREALQTRVQLLLSWREKASRLLREAKPSIGAKRGLYRAHMRQADHYLIQTVEQQQGLTQKLGTELQTALLELGRIDDRAAAGRIRPEDALMAKGEIERRVERLREEISLLNRVLRAKRAHELGGMIDLPLEQYAPKLGILPVVRRRDGWQPRHYLGIGTLALVCALFSYAYYQRAAAPSLECAGQYRPAPAEALLLTLRNNGNQLLRLRVPWPNAIPAGLEEADCGLSLYASNAARNEYQLVPTTPTEWLRFGAPLAGQEYITMAPGVEETLELSLRPVRNRIATAEAFRIEATTASAELLCSHDWEAPPPAPVP